MTTQTQVGRPPVINEDTVRKLEAAFRDGLSVITACHLSGISRSTFYEYCDNDKEFSDKMTVARQWVTERARKVVAAAINKDDLATAKWWLERKASDEFGKDARDEKQGETDRYQEKLVDRMKAFMDDRSEDDFLEAAAE